MPTTPVDRGAVDVDGAIDAASRIDLRDLSDDHRVVVAGVGTTGLGPVFAQRLLDEYRERSVLQYLQEVGARCSLRQQNNSTSVSGRFSPGSSTGSHAAASQRREDARALRQHGIELRRMERLRMEEEMREQSASADAFHEEIRRARESRLAAALKHSEAVRATRAVELQRLREAEREEHTRQRLEHREWEAARVRSLQAQRVAAMEAKTMAKQRLVAALDERREAARESVARVREKLTYVTDCRQHITQTKAAVANQIRAAHREALDGAMSEQRDAAQRRRAEIADFSVMASLKRGRGAHQIGSPDELSHDAPSPAAM